MKYRFIILILLVSKALLAQENPEGEIFTYQEFMDIVQKHHPMSQQAALMVERGEANFLKSKGNFDPKTFGTVDQKYFDGKNYYSQIHGGLKVPTWLGLDIAGGYETNDGLFLNPQENVPQNGLWYAGLSLPVGQNLIVDQRRTEVRKARIFRESTKVQQQLMLNELLQKAGKAYWDWFRAYHAQEVYREAVEAASIRMDAVRKRAVIGERPRIDTLEAGLQLQNRQMSLRQATLEVNNTALELSVYLWQEGTLPLELAEETRPPEINTALSADFVPLFNDSLLNNHPALQQYRYKVQELELDRRLKRERLKPELNLKYNALLEPMGDETWANYNSANYTWGLEFSFPLFLRKERGDLKLANIYVQETQLELEYKQQALNNQMRSSINEWDAVNDQLDISTQMVEDYQGLLNGEQRKFNAGESSLFLVNSREVQLINSRIKFLELLSKREQKELDILFSQGNLFSIY